VHQWISKVTVKNPSLLSGFLCLVLLASLQGCLFPGVFRIDIAQGNLFTQQMVDRLSPGMTQEQVRYVMGTPSIEDPLHPDRWDYIYSWSQAGGDPKVYKLSLHFEGNKYTHHTGSAPNESELPFNKDKASH